MECGFFCDTGVIIGLCDMNDHHHNSCKFFFDKYPVETHHYYTIEIIEKELKNKKRKLEVNTLKNHPQAKILHVYVRRVQQCIDIYLKKMKSFNCKDHGETSINQLKNLIVCIQPIIGVEAINQVNDIEIVANGIVWSLVKDYDSPRLITVDNKDLSRNELKIVKESEKTLKEHVPLKILYLPNYLKH
jgi:hypothetical protein